MTTKKANKRFQSSVGFRIREERKKKNMTQERLAEILDVSVITISRIENGSSPLHFEDAVGIANALDIPLDDLIPDDDEYASRRRIAKEFVWTLFSLRKDFLELFLFVS